MTTTTINTTTEHIKIIRSVHFIQIVHFWKPLNALLIYKILVFHYCSMFRHITLPSSGRSHANFTLAEIQYNISRIHYISVLHIYYILASFKLVCEIHDYV
jgi:hypothetical protein